MFRITNAVSVKSTKITGQVTGASSVTDGESRMFVLTDS